ncbi:MAG: alpha/beta hydrolase fold domain-containing protein [Candidatus Binatia bacterium]
MRNPYEIWQRAVQFIPLMMVVWCAGCTQHIGRPETDAPTRAASGTYTLHQNIVYTPVSWPQRLEADVYVPAGVGPFPGVLVIHGGGWQGGTRADMNHIAKRLVQRGYTAVNISYRFAPASHFPAQIQDLQQAVRWMRQNAAAYRIDPQWIGVFGYSAGGHLAALLGTIRPGDGFDDKADDPSTRIQAVVVGGAPTDLRKFRGGRLVPQFLGTTIDKNPQVFAHASPIVHVSSDDPPMFLYHGSLDTLVDISHATDMKQALDAANVPAELYIVRGLGHIAVFIINDSAIEAGIAFLDRWLRSH